MNQRNSMMWVLPAAGFLIVVAFGVGVIVTAAYDSHKPFGVPVQAAGGNGGEQVIEVELGDLFIKPAKLEAEPGAARFDIINGGKAEHNFSIQGLGGTEMVPPGGTATLRVASLQAGSYTYICEVAGHAQGGMTGILTVGDSSDAVDGGHDMAAMSAEEMVKQDSEVTASFPAKTKGSGGKPLKPRIASDGAKVFELTADEISWEIEPGKVVDAMAYNGQIPGPSITADLGDKVRIVLHNKLAQPTTIHFHGLIVSNSQDGVPGITQDAVMPGDSYTYEFTLRNSGTHMYHPHFNAQDQVLKGLLGAFLVSDPSDPKVDVDQTIVINDGPLGFTLNGKGFPATSPVVAELGDTVRIRYMNEGLLMHPMHLHGMTQRVIAKDGYMLDSPYDVDTLPVAPGERYDVIVKASEPGVWAFHCHILNHAESPNGMFGMVTAMVVH
ncbi:MAG: multicopper oxidase domain-containing protein [Actinomycetota bacterium]